MKSKLYSWLEANTFAKAFLIISFVATGLWTTNSFAQATLYSFSSTTGVSLQTLTTPTTLVSAGVDDGASVVTALPFSFNFGGTTYTQFSASSNGLFGLGGSTVTTAYSNSITGASYPVLMPWWDDLYTATGGVQYQTFGTAPNRILVTQYNVTNCCAGGTPDKVFQVWLYETSNLIMFVYGAGASPNTSSIGIATASGNFISITSAAGTGTSSTVTANNSNAVWPGSGTAYVFTNSGSSVTGYTFSTAPGFSLYTLSSPTTLVAAGNDDASSSVTSIPFTFNFGGTNYTQFSASSNGLFGFGSSSVTTAYSNNITGASYPNIMPWWDDLYTGTGGVQYQVFGSAPNRVLVTQWSVTNCCTGGTPDKIFQVQLFETSNLIIMAYGAGANFSSASVGIARTSADYNSVTTSSNTNSTTVANNSNATWPGTGRAYIYNLIPAPTSCSGTPSAGVITGPSSACAAVSFSVTSSGLSTGAGISYQWQVSTTGCGGSFSNISGQTTGTLSTTQSVASAYRLVTTCSNSGLTNTSNCISVAMNSPTACYCTPPASVYACTYDWIGNVTVNTLNNTTGCSTTSYTLFPATGSTTTSLQIGTPYTMSLSDVGYGGYFSVFIDLNQDGVFQSSERLVQDLCAGCPSGFGNFTNTTSITIPSGATTGTTRMRVRYDYNYTNYNGLGEADPCGQLYEGETEDYTITILPPCATTFNVTGGGSTCPTVGIPVGLSGSQSGFFYQLYLNSVATGSPVAGSGFPISFPNQSVAGTYTVTATNNSTCTQAMAGSAVITNITAPNLTSVTASPTSVCYNGSSTLTANINAPALIANYTFAQSISTYTPLVGATSVVGPGGFNDDTGFGPFPLGFTFTYHGVPFTTIGLQDNVSATLGAVGTGYTAMQFVANTIAVMNADMLGSSSTNNLRYMTTGGAGNHVFTAEWYNWGKYNDGGLNQINVQLQLFEATGQVRIVYQPVSPSSSFTCQVGMCGATTSDFNDRTSTGSWSSSVAGGSNAATMQFDAVNFPANGLTFTWTPPVTSFTYTWSTGGPGGLSSTSTNPTTGINITGNTVYTVSVSNGSCASTGTVTVNSGATLAAAPTAVAPPVTPCTPPVSALACVYDWIGNVSVNSLNSTSNCASTSYTLFPQSGNTTTSLAVGTSYPMSLGSIGYGGYFSVFVDLNQDGIFQPSERLVQDLCVGCPSGFGNFTGTTTLTIPAGAINGTTIMRVRYDYLYTNYNSGGESSPCGQLYEGETEDYPITITGGVPGGLPCPGGTWSLVANATGGGAPYNYSWSGPGLLSTNTATVSAIPPAGSTTYTVVVTDACGQSITQTLAVNVANVSVSVSPGTTTMCAGNSVTLNASGSASSFAWSPATGLNTTTGSTVIATPSATTTYTVTASTGACTSTATAVVNVSPAPTFTSITASPASICPNGTSQLTAVVPVGGPLPTTYCSPVMYPSNPCNYLNSVSSSGGLTNFNNVTGSYNGTGYTFFPSMIVTQNLGGSFTLSCQTQGTCGIAYYTIWVDWNQNGSFDEPTERVVSANSLNSGNNLTNFTINVPLTASPGSTRIRIIADGNSTNPTTACDNFSAYYSEVEDYVLTIPSVSGVTYSWSPTTFLNNPNISNPVASGVSSTTAYTVTATAAGCSSTGTVTVTVGGTLTATATATAPPALPPPSPYCTFTSSFGCSGYGDEITNFSYGGINRSSACDYYVNTGLTANITAGVSNPMTINTGVANLTNEGVAVWIDLNQNGVFDNSELMYSNYSGADPATYNTNITIPTSAYNGTTRMRVECWYAAIPSSPCLNTSYGEAEDYNVNITGGTALPSGLCPGSVWTLAATPSGGGQPYTYNWSGPGLITNNAASVTAAAPAGSTNYTVVITDACGTSLTQTVTTTNLNISSVSVSPSSPSPICQGLSTTLTASGSGSYSWSPSTGLNTTTGSVVNATPTTTTTYTVTGLTSGCTSTATSTITIVPAPAITATATPALICNGGSSQLAGAVQSSALITYSEHFDSGVTPTTQCTNWNTFLASLTSHPYTRVTMKGSNDPVGISITDPVVVSQIAAAMHAGSAGTFVSGSQTWMTGTCGGGLELTNTGSICFCSNGYTLRPCIGNLNWGGINGATCGAASQTMTVEFEYSVPVSGGITYSWSPSSNLDNASIATPFASGITSNTTYTETATNDAGCSSTSTVTVSVAGPVTATVTASTPEICSGTGITVGASPAGGRPPYTYLWSNGQTTSSISVAPNSSTSYSCIITDACGQTTSSSTSVTVDQTPTVSASSPVTICSGNSTVLTATGTGNSYMWSPPTGLNNASLQNPTASPTSTTTYTVTATIGVCTATASTTVTVNLVAPTVTASVSPTAVCPGDLVNLTGTGTLPASGDYSVASIPFAPVSGSTTVAVSGDDAMSGAVSLPFAFTYYGTTYSSIYMSTNGFASFSNVGALCCNGNAFPGNPFASMLAIGWYDYISTVDYFTLSSPNRFVMDWVGSEYSYGGAINAQMILYQDGTIEYHITNMSDIGHTGTMGIQNSNGTLGTAVAGRNGTFGWGSIASEGWRFTPPTSSSVSYQWSASPSATINNATSANATANPTVATTYTLTVTGGGCTSTATTVQVTMNSAPVTISASSTSVCQNGSSITLSSNFDGPYATYSGNGVTGNTFNPSAPGVVVGNNPVTVTYTPPIGCSGSATVNINVLALPNATATVSGANPRCRDLATGLVATGGGTYSWTGPLGFTSSVATPIISAVNANPAHSGVYTVTVTGTNGCTAQTSTNVTWWEKPTVAASATNSPVCEGNTLNLVGGVNWNGETPSSTPFQWLDADGNFFPGNNAQNPSFGPMDKELAGEWTFKATTNHGCFRTSTVQVDVLAAPYFTSGPAANSVAATGNSDANMCSKSNVTYTPVGANALLYHLYNYDFDAEAVLDDDHEDYPVDLTYNFSNATTGSGSGDGNGSTFNVGTTNVVVTAATDISGCTSTLPFNVVINDIQVPVITATGDNTALSCNPSAAAIEAALGTATATDNCSVGAPSFVDSPVSADGCDRCQTRTWNVTDAHGNAAVPVSRTVCWIEDHSTPEIIVESTVADLGCNPSSGDIDYYLGTAVLASNTVLPGYCNHNSISVTTGPVTNIGCSYQQTRYWVATNSCSGNTSTASHTVNWIVDTQAPVISSIPANVTVSCAADVPAVNDNAVVATDNCSTPRITHDADVVTAGSCANRFTITRTYYAADNCGNTSSRTQTITVNDQTAPVFSGCPANIVLAACTPTATWTAPTASDNCAGGATVTQTAGPASGSTFANGTTTTITYTAVDGCGNSSTCSFTVTRRAALVCNAGADENTYFGYTADQTFTHTATVTGGLAPYNYSWTFTRLTGASLTPLPASTGGLRCNNVTSSGDEIFNVIGSPLTYSNAYWTCSGVSTANYIAPAYPTVSGPNATSIQLMLMDTARVTLTVTDANGCSTQCSFVVYAEDARCWAGNSSIQKVTICHRSGNNTCATICVDSSAIAAHLAHGDAVGQCPRSGCPTGGKLDENATNMDAASYLTAYPNPFNEKTTIAFSVPKDGRAIIRIYDALGKEIGVLFDGMAKSGQMYKVDFDGSRYAEGMYFYSITSDDMNQTKRMNLIK